MLLPLVLVLGARWDATGAAVRVPRRHVRVRAHVARPARPAARPAALEGRLERDRGAVRVLLVSGIWPPDVGGPASHAPEVAAFLRSRGHDVEVVVTAAGDAGAAGRTRCTGRAGGCRRAPRHLHSAALVARLARRADVVYTTGMFARSALGARLARRPYVVKLTGDPAFERLRARGQRRRHGRGVPGGRRPPGARARQPARVGAARRRARLLPERVPALARARVGRRPGPHGRAAESRAGSRRPSATATSCAAASGSTASHSPSPGG